MEGIEHKESIYGYEVVDECSGSEDEPIQAEKYYNFYEEKKHLNRPTEGEIDAFLENVKELSSCGTSGLKDDLISCNSTLPNSNLLDNKALSPIKNVTVNAHSPNGTPNINLSNNILNFHSSDSDLKSSRSRVSYKPGGTLLKTIFPHSTHSISENSRSLVCSQELSSPSANLLTHSLKQNEELGDGFSDNRNQDLNNTSKKRDHIENDLRHRHKRSPEHSTYVEGKRLDRNPSSTFSRERCNSRKEMFNERSSRDKRRTEERRSRGKSRSRSRARRRHRRRSATYLSLSPPPSREIEAVDKRRERGVGNNVMPYYPGIGSLPPYLTPAYPQPNPTPEEERGDMARFGMTQPHNFGGQNQTYGGPNQPYSGPNQPYSGPNQMYGGQTGYQAYQPLVAYPQAYQPPVGYPPPVSYPLPPPPTNPLPTTHLPPYSNVNVNNPNENYFGSSCPSGRLWNEPARERRSYSRSSSPESEKRRSKRPSRSPEPWGSRNSSETERDRKQRKMIIDPNRIPTPPPPPILSGTRSTTAKSAESSFSEMLDKETVSLSCLLEAVMETSGQGKSKVSDPKVKNEILSKCETKFRQLYKKKVAGRGAFLPDPVEARGVSAMCSPLVLAHPRLSYNEQAEPEVWRCPRVKLPPAKPSEPPPVSKPPCEPSPICTLDRGGHEPLPAPQPGYDQRFSDFGYSTFPNYSAGYKTQAPWPTANNPPTYEQYNVVTYPNLYPSQLVKTDSYPFAPIPNYSHQMEKTLSDKHISLKKTLEETLPALKKAEPEPSPSKYRDESLDVLLLSEKKSKKKKKRHSLSPPKQSSIKKQVEGNNEVTSDFPQNHRFERSLPIVTFPKRKYVNPNLVQLVTYHDLPQNNSKAKPDVDDDEKYKYDRKRKLNEKISHPKNDTTFDSPDEAKEKLRRNSSNCRKVGENKHENDETSISIDVDDEDVADEEKAISPPGTHLGEARPLDQARRQPNKHSSNYRLHSSSKSSHRDEKTLNTIETSKKKDADIIEIMSDSEDNGRKIEKVTDSKANSQNFYGVNKLTFNNICDIGPELRKIQEKSLLYSGIIESMEKGDHSYKRLYTFNNSALCKIEKVSKKLKVVVPRDNLKEFVIILHKNFHSISQDDMLRSLMDCIYPPIPFVSKCISKVFSECSNCVRPTLKVEPLVDKKVDKKSLKKTEKDTKSPIKKDKSKSPEVGKSTEGRRRGNGSHSSSRQRSYGDKGKRSADKREHISPSTDRTPSGYEKAKKSRITPSKQDTNVDSKIFHSKQTGECSDNISAKPEQIHDSTKTDAESTETCNKNGGVAENESITQVNTEPTSNELCEGAKKGKVENENKTENENIKDNNEIANKKEEFKPGENSVKSGSGLDFKSKIRNVQIKEFGEIICSLESGDNCKEFENTYLLKGGMLCRKIQNESSYEVKIVSVSGHIDDVLHIVHTMSFAHTPAPKMVAFFEKHFTTIDNIKDKVYDFVSKCSQLCQSGGLAYEEQLIIDPDFRTTAEEIFAAGPFTRYSPTLLTDAFDHTYYNSVEIGAEVMEMTTPGDGKYCGECGLTTDQCIFGTKYEKCLQWLRKHDQEEYRRLLEKALLETPRRRKTCVRLKTGKAGRPWVALKRICCGQKHLTIVTGLERFLGKNSPLIVNIAETMKCHTILTEKNAIVLYGDFKQEMKRYISEKFHIDPLDIVDKGDLVRTDFLPKH